MIKSLAEPLARIILRYIVGGAFVYFGLPEDVAKHLMEDPDVALVLVVFIGIVVEGSYAYARKTGRPT